ncbi:MFS transporter [Streptomyces sp. KL116D]|uniref:MFS transporter n=1 Tax=Streptomyces sp. KL116D TaxID=3045152 RepID=UPI003556D6F3
MVSLVAWSVFTAATSLAPGLVALLVLRALFGISQALFPAASSFKALTERTTSATRSRSAGLMLASNSLGAGLGPLIVAPIIVMADWRHTFWIIAAAGLVVGLVLWRLMPSPLPPELTEPDTPAVAAAAPVGRVLRNGLVLRCALMFAMLQHAELRNDHVGSVVPGRGQGLSMVHAGVSAAIPAHHGGRRGDRRPAHVPWPGRGPRADWSSPHSSSRRPCSSPCSCPARRRHSRSSSPWPCSPPASPSSASSAFRSAYCPATSSAQAWNRQHRRTTRRRTRSAGHGLAADLYGFTSAFGFLAAATLAAACASP